MIKGIYFWRTTQLARDLADDKIDPKQKMIYLLLLQLLYVVLSYFPIFPGFDEFNWLLVSEFLVVIVVVVIGILICFKNNREENGASLIEYFTCLSVPLTIKLTLIFAGVLYFFGWVVALLINWTEAEDPKLFTQIAIFFLVVLFEIIFFYRMSSHIKSISSIRSNEKSI